MILFQFFGSGFGRGETWNWAGVGDMSSKDVVGYRGVKLVLKITNPFIKARNWSFAFYITFSIKFLSNNIPIKSSKYWITLEFKWIGKIRNWITQKFKKIDKIHNWITLEFNGNHNSFKFYQISKSNIPTLFLHFN